MEYERPTIEKIGDAEATVLTGKPNLPYPDSPGFTSISAYAADE